MEFATNMAGKNRAPWRTLKCNTACVAVTASQCELCSVLLVIWEEFVLAT